MTQIYHSKESILSLDVSLRSTGVYLDGVCSTIKNKPSVPQEFAIYNTAIEIQNILLYKNVSVILVEDYSYNSAGRGVTTLAEMKGAITYIAMERKIPIVYIPISVWKNIMDFNLPKAGKGWREKYIKEVYDKWSFLCSTPDEVDAYLMYKAVLKIMCIKTPTPTQKRIQDQMIVGINL